MNTHLREARLKAGLTQGQVGALVDRDAPAISRIEAGIQSVTIELAPNLAKVLNLPVLTVLYGPRRAKRLAKIGQDAA